MGLGDVVALAVRGRVAIRVGDKGVGRVDKVWFRSGHELATLDVDFLAVGVEAGSVAESEQDATRRPGEFIPERVIGALGGGQAAAVGEEGKDTAAGSVDFGDGLDGVEMVDSGIETDFVHDGDAGFAAALVESLHGWRHVAGCHDVLALADGGLDDGGVVGVGDQADDEVDGGDGGVEGGGIGDVEGDGVGIFDAGGELLGGLEGAAGWGCQRG